MGITIFLMSMEKFWLDLTCDSTVCMLSGLLIQVQ